MTSTAQELAFIAIFLMLFAIFLEIRAFGNYFKQILELYIKDPELWRNKNK